MDDLVRGMLLTFLGGLVGATVAVLVWLVIALVISNAVAYFYPGWSSRELGSWPSDESCLTSCTLILILPFAALLGGSVGVTRVQRIEARWVLQSLPHGLIATFRDDGSLFAETTYHQGLAHGPYRDYWSNNNIACEGQYSNGLQEGEWRYYNPDGSQRIIVHFFRGREVKG